MSSKKINNYLEKLTDIYIFIIIVIFPLIVDKTGFFRILECKYRCFLVISITYLTICIIFSIYSLIKKINILKKRTVTRLQKIMILFLLVNIISCFSSPFFNKYNLFIGVGRKEGLIASSLYILSYLFISYFGKFKKRHILYFSISSILISLIAILQYIGFNPFNMYQNGIGTHNVSFMTTIGNVDFISAVYTIFLSISFASYIFLDNKKEERTIHLLSIFMGSFIFQIIDVNSGKLAFITVLVIIFPFILQNNIRLSNFLKIVSTILLGTAINIFMNIEYHYDIGRLGFYFNFNYIVVLFIIVIILLYILSNYLSKLNFDITKNKKIVINYYKLLGLLFILTIIMLYIIPFKGGFLYEIHELLHFNFDDDFGTYRIFLWKRTIPLIKDYPIFGSGPDTFALRFMPLYSDDIAKIGPLTINDTAANIYLTMLINLGIVGTINYVVLLLYTIYEGIKRIDNNSLVLLIAIICYIIQSFFNLSVVIVTPLFYTLLGIHHLCIYNKKRRSKKNEN